MIDNEATVQIACNGKYTARLATSNEVSTMSAKANKMEHINYTGYLVHHNLLTFSQKHKSHPKLIYTSTKSSVHSLIICYILLTNQQRFDSRRVSDIQYRPTIFYIYPYP